MELKKTKVYIALTPEIQTEVEALVKEAQEQIDLATMEKEEVEKKLSKAEADIKDLEIKLSHKVKEVAVVPEKKKPTPNPDYKPEFELTHLEETRAINPDTNEPYKRKVNNKVVLLPTEENEHHKQGEKFIMEAPQAIELIKKGLAKYVETIDWTTNKPKKA